MLARLGQTTDPRYLRPQLQELRGFLERHFAEEESPGGLVSAVGDSAPGLLARLGHIFDQHQRFLETLDTLCDRTEACLRGPMAEILDGVAALSRGLEEHEVVEDRLIAEAAYTELGTAD